MPGRATSTRDPGRHRRIPAPQRVPVPYDQRFRRGRADQRQSVTGRIGAGTYLMWLLAATIGNTVGGVLMVSLLNYGQVVGSGDAAERSLAEIEDKQPARRRRRKRG